MQTKGQNLQDFVQKHKNIHWKVYCEKNLLPIQLYTIVQTWIFPKKRN